MHNTQCEIRLTPKELSAEMERAYGIRRTPSYIRSIRAYSNARGEWLFVAGCATAADLFKWLATNKDFRRTKAERGHTVMIGSM